MKKTEIENKNIDRVLFNQLKEINFEYLVQLDNLIADAIEEQGEDSLSKEMETFNTTLNKVVHIKCKELINAEKKLKEILENDDKIEFEAEARELVEGLNARFNGKTIERNVMDWADRLTEQIIKFKSLKNSIDTINNTLRLKLTNDTETIIFANYLAIWNVLSYLIEKDWVDIEEFEDVKEEYMNVIEYLDNVIGDIRKGMDYKEEEILFLSQFGLKDDIYVRELEKDSCGYILLENDNQDRLTDVLRIY